MKNNDYFIYAAGLFPEPERAALLKAGEVFAGTVEEIRLYKDKPVILNTDRGIKYTDKNGLVSSFVTEKSLRAASAVLSSVVVSACSSSLYAHEKELCEGYITTSCGIRIGICAAEADKMLTPDRITSLNIRLPCSGDEAFITELPAGYIAEGGLLIAGAPGSGKTTLLKSCCRFLCRTGGEGFKRVSVIDPRGELAAFSFGTDCYAADVLSCTDRAAGIQRALRLMSPEYIICDETGTSGETKGMMQGMNSGVKFIAAMHAGNVKELVRREQFRRLFAEGVFSRAVLLSETSPGKITAVYGREELENEIRKYHSSVFVTDFRGA